MYNLLMYMLFMRSVFVALLRIHTDRTGEPDRSETRSSVARSLAGRSYLTHKSPCRHVMCRPLMLLILCALGLIHLGENIQQVNCLIAFEVVTIVGRCCGGCCCCCC